MLRLLSLLLALVFAVSEASAEETFAGAVKRIDRAGTPIRGATKEVVAGVLVEGFYVHLDKQTLIVFDDARRGSIADLRVGQRISFRLASDIACTDPPQVQTDLIVIRTLPAPK
jgi:hypothetical protein